MLLAARLRDRLGVLSALATTPAHHRTLEASFGCGFELCTPAERVLWTRVAVFTGSFDLAAVEYVCTGSGLPAGAVAAALAGLADKSVLLREEHTGGEERWRLLDTIRRYGLGRLRAAGGARGLDGNGGVGRIRGVGAAGRVG